MKLKRLFFLSAILIVMWSCNNDDDEIERIPPKTLSEVVIEDHKKLKEFLDSHFYNYEDFEAPIDPAFDFNIVIDSIEGENSNKIPLSAQVDSVEVKVSSFEFGLNNEEEDIVHKLYYLNAKEGSGDNPSAADSVFVRYKGKLLDGTSFDGSNTGTWFDLARIQAPLQGTRGFSEGVSLFKAGNIPGPDQQPEDGTFIVEDYGVGAIFMPSGLGYFNSRSGSISAYSPLIFEIDLLTLNFSDHDNDGIPSSEEDLNGNGYLYDDNSDRSLEEENGSTPIVDFLDIDDDGDGILTRTEISDVDGNIILPYPITGGGTVPDYLNPDVQRDPNN